VFFAKSGHCARIAERDDRKNSLFLRWNPPRTVAQKYLHAAAWSGNGLKPQPNLFVAAKRPFDGAAVAPDADDLVIETLLNDVLRFLTGGENQRG
jgi:hypothetical protein